MDLDEFSDDGLDDLPDNALQELENQAIHFTQAQQFTQRPRTPQDGQRQQRYSAYTWEDDDDDLDTTEVINDEGVPVGRPVVDKTLRQQQSQAEIQDRGPPKRPPAPPAPNPRWNPSVQSARGAPSMLVARPRLPDVASSSQRIPNQSQTLGHPRGSQLGDAALLSPKSKSKMQALLTRLKKLESDLSSAQGENAILRSSLQKAKAAHDTDINRLLRVNGEQKAEQDKRVAAALAAEKSANTELEFLQSDMKEVSARTRRKEPARATSSRLATPKKAVKTRNFADGFDDLDIAVSPSKAQGRAKNAGSIAANVGERTPSKGKRKRPVSDSPMKPLDILTGDVEMAEVKIDSDSFSKSVIVAPPATPFDFLQVVFDHGYAQGQPLTFDMLSRFVFTTDPTGTSLASLVFQRLPMMGNPHTPTQLLADFIEQIIILWERCYDEKLWEPIKYLVSLILFTIQLHTTGVAPGITERLVPIAHSTIYTVGEASADGSAGDPGVKNHIDATQIMSLLYAMASSCALVQPESENSLFSVADFWSNFPLHTALMFLQWKQKTVDIIGMLDLLTTSSLPNTIGPISSEMDSYTAAKTLIERVSSKLSESPRSVLAAERRLIRLAALRTLISFSKHRFGAQEMARHDHALVRMVSCLSASLDELYDQPIPSTVLLPLPESIKSSGVKLPESTSSLELYRIISQSVHLIHNLVTDSDTADLADISRKLSMSHGGSQRYLIALGRLTFAEEDLVIEAGIEAEVAEAAQELLERYVTEEEGLVVTEAFGGMTPDVQSEHS